MREEFKEEDDSLDIKPVWAFINKYPIVIVIFFALMSIMMMIPVWNAIEIAELYHLDDQGTAFLITHNCTDPATPELKQACNMQLNNFLHSISFYKSQPGMGGID
jgi:hypothetical protein